MAHTYQKRQIILGTTGCSYLHTHRQIVYQKNCRFDVLLLKCRPPSSSDQNEEDVFGVKEPIVHGLCGYKML